MSTKKDFAHLHVHTDYSMLDGAAKVSGLVSRAVELGQNAVAITDHGYLFGAFDFYKTCKENNIKPIIGLEAYLTPGTSRFDKTRQRWGSIDQKEDDVSANGAYTHMTLLARNNTGLHNLFRMGSLASLEGQFGKWPRIDRELLQKYAPGLIGTTGCPSGEVQTRLRLGQWDEALQAAADFRDIFGPENFYVEVMDHGLDLDRRVREDLLKIAKKLNLPLLATNDSHYVLKEDEPFQDALLCINSGSVLTDPDRFRFTPPTYTGTVADPQANIFGKANYFLRSSEEMWEIWKDLPEACSNTLLVAEQCDVSFKTVKEGADFMPVFDCPPGEDQHSWFIKEVERGLNYRFPNGVPDEVRKQAEYECDIITRMGFPGYFLVVADFINWAKEHGIRVGPGRGSGAGSMVAYAMRITDLNPLKHGLLFERFLNPERVSMPDFDVDFDERRRGEVIEYVTKKYGGDRVAQVVTYGKIKTKQALKDSARILGLPFSLGDKMTKAMPPSVMGKDIPVAGMFNEKHPRYSEAEEFRRLYEEDDAVKESVKLALGIEGLTRQWGVHACAVIMSSEPLIDIIPMMKRPADGAVITQFEYPQCEELGLLKMDFLGLRNLTIISDALNNIKENGKEEFDIESLSLDDKASYELLSRGETLGVFQLDSTGIRDLLIKMRPDHFEDISAVLALYRPGPMGADSHTNYALRKNGLQKITPIHPELEEPLKDILDVTYGLIVYQEQVMAIAQRLAGYTLGQADLLRRAMGKKKKAILDAEYGPFREGMIKNGYSDDAVKTLWDILVPFSDYAFNKSHTAAYGLVAYWTAYLKANYPTEYMAALLTSQKDNKDKLAMYLGECRRMDITVLPPDVNSSADNFTPVGEDIRFGLAAIRNVGVNVVSEIINARKEKGEFTSFQDFLDKVPVGVCNKRTILSLILAGAFDSLGNTRRSLEAIYEEALEAIISVKHNEAKGQFDLFSGLDLGEDARNDFAVDIPDLPEWNKKDKLNKERDMLGLYVSDHPLRGLEYGLSNAADTSILQITKEEGIPDGSHVTIAGLLGSVTRKTNKSGNLWAKATVEDLTGSIDITIFPKMYGEYSHLLTEDAIVKVEGRVSRWQETPEISALSISVLDINPDDAQEALELHLSDNSCNADFVKRLGELLRSYPGSVPVYLHVHGPKVTKVIDLGSKYFVDRSGALLADLKVLAGPDCLTNPRAKKKK